MGELTVTYPQMEDLQQQQVASKDSIAINSSLRTPIQEVEAKQPKHLQLNKCQPWPQKVVYETWTREDSVYFNLVQSEAGVFFHKLQVTSSETEGIVSEDTTVLDVSVQNIAAGRVKNTTIPDELVNIRKGSPLQDSKDWLSGVILLVLIIAGFVKLYSGKYISDLFSSIRYQQSASKLFPTFNMQNEKPGWALTILFFLGASLFVFEYVYLGGRSPKQIRPFIFFLLINAGIILYFLLKSLLYRFVAFVFDTQQGTKEYIFNANLLSKAFGIVTLPVVCVVPFVDVLTATFLLKVGLFMFLIMYFIQLIRGAKIILRTPLSIFYMFLYFCALEILPLSLLIKVMIY